MPKNTDGSIPVSVSFARWRKDPEYVRAYEARKEEFAELDRQIKARAATRLKRKQAKA